MTSRQRLFFALWPDPPLQQTILRLSQASLSLCQGRILDASQIHITLAYLGSVDEEIRACAEQAADQVKCVGFQLALSQLGFFKKPHVAWLAPEIVPPELTELGQQLNNQLVPCGYRGESRPFMPHLTLVRKAKRPPPGEYD